MVRVSPTRSRRSPGFTAADLSWRAGVDVLSLGGTKNGLNTAEAVVFFDPALAAQFDYRGKQAGQLASKMRFPELPVAGRARIRRLVAPRGPCQCDGATPGRGRSARCRDSRLARAVEVNAVFVDMSAAVAEAMFAMGWHFYTLSGAGYRLMCSWATTAEDVAAFARDLQRIVSES